MSGAAFDANAKLVSDALRKLRHVPEPACRAIMQHWTAAAATPIVLELTRWKAHLMQQQPVTLDTPLAVKMSGQAFLRHEASTAHRARIREVLLHAGRWQEGKQVLGQSFWTGMDLQIGVNMLPVEHVFKHIWRTSPPLSPAPTYLAHLTRQDAAELLTACLRSAMSNHSAVSILAHCFGHHAICIHDATDAHLLLRFVKLLANDLSRSDYLRCPIILRRLLIENNAVWQFETTDARALQRRVWVDKVACAMCLQSSDFVACMQVPKDWPPPQCHAIENMLWRAVCAHAPRPRLVQVQQAIANKIHPLPPWNVFQMLFRSDARDMLKQPSLPAAMLFTRILTEPASGEWFVRQLPVAVGVVGVVGDVVAAGGVGPPQHQHHHPQHPVHPTVVAAWSSFLNVSRLPPTFGIPACTAVFQLWPFHPDAAARWLTWFPIRDCVPSERCHSQCVAVPGHATWQFWVRLLQGQLDAPNLPPSQRDRWNRAICSCLVQEQQHTE